MSLEGGSDIRRFLHRAFAVVFVVLATYHLLWLVFTEKGREELRKLAPNRKDAREAAGLIGYNAGLRKEKPVYSGKYSYIEKMEYWALVWGTGIMTLTGFFLTFENWTLKYFPKWVVDLMLTVHFYEALLAILAILVWHFYWTVFDPNVYPMNWAWLTGFIKRKKNGKDSGKHE
jgi:cytochrome b subunit of formate dehydrogenase